MKVILGLAVVLAANCGLAAPALHGPPAGGTGDYEYAPARAVVWTQLPLVGGHVFVSQYDELTPNYDNQCADDFSCSESTGIIGIEWWGTYWNWDPPPPPPPMPPDYFVIRFYGDWVGDPDVGLPGPLLLEDYCLDYHETYIPEWELYHYVHDLAVPFPAEAGVAYWVSIQAGLCFPPQWGWAECDPSHSWGNQGAIRAPYFGFPDWTPLELAVGFWSELAFVLHDSPVPVEGSSWGGIKAVFR